MNPFFWLVKEMRFRWVQSALTILGLAAAAAVFVASRSSLEALQRETVRVTRDMGFNLRIIPAATDMERFWTVGYSDLTMPEEMVTKLAGYNRVFFSFNHLMATLQKRFTIAGHETILTGVAPTITAAEQRNRPLGPDIQQGTLICGFEAAGERGWKAGRKVEIGGKKFQISKVLVETGTEEDLRVYAHLHDAQQLLGLPGAINEIKAIDCLCLTSKEGALEKLRAELEKALPEARVLQMRAIADSRARQRQTAERFSAYLTPCLIVVAAGWVALLGILNVRERRYELGILRALGYGAARMAGLILGKAVLLGLVGAAAGWGAGSWVALRFAPKMFEITGGGSRVSFEALHSVLVGAVVVSLLGAAIPAILAMTTDPADVLREGN